jgi:hypothetical protein
MKNVLPFQERERVNIAALTPELAAQSGRLASSPGIVDRESEDGNVRHTLEGMVMRGARI